MDVLESQLSVKVWAISQLSVKIAAQFSAISKFCRSQISLMSLKTRHFSAYSQNFEQFSAIR